MLKKPIIFFDKDGEAGGSSDGASGTNSNSPEGEGDKSQGDTVSHSSYKRVLGEAKKAKADNVALREKIAEYEAEQEAQRQAEDEKQGKYKERLAEEKKKRKDAESKLESFRNERESAIKRHALLSSVGGEIDQKYWPLLDDHVNKIGYDRDTNTIDETSVTEGVEAIRNLFPDIIVTKQGAGFSSKAPSSGGGNAITYEEWKRLPLDEMDARQKDVID